MTEKRFEDPVLPALLAKTRTLGWLFVIVIKPFQTPAVKAVVVAGEIVPVLSVSAAVPVKLVTMLFNVSCARIVIWKDAPAVCGPLISTNEKWSTPPELTLNGSEDPCFPALLAVITSLVWLVLIVTLPVQTPAVKAVVGVGEIEWVILSRPAVPVKLVTVLSKESLAVMVIVNGTPAVCVLIGEKAK